MSVIATILAVLCVAWIAQAIVTVAHLRSMRTLVDERPPAPAVWPSVSVIVPARDESRSIEAALRTRLSDDYPQLQLVVVDDRSADGTGEIVDALAAEDARVVPVHVVEVPDGWLGKLNALERGMGHATGEWVLLSDADIHMERGTLSRAVAYCLAHDIDFLALIPEFRSPSFAVNVVWSVFMRVLVMSLDPAAVRDGGKKAAAGSGSFMLMRRSVYDASERFEHLRMETGDDMALGMMVKRTGARCEFMNGRDAAWLPSYGSYAELVRGIEKNGATMLGVPLPLVVAGMLLAACVELSPIAAVAVGWSAGIGWLYALGVATLALATATNIAALRTNTGTWVPALLWPLGWLGMAFAVTRSSWLAHRRGGVQWRGTFYSREELLAGQRFTLGG